MTDSQSKDGGGSVAAVLKRLYRKLDCGCVGLCMCSYSSTLNVVESAKDWALPDSYKNPNVIAYIHSIRVLFLGPNVWGVYQKLGPEKRNDFAMACAVYCLSRGRAEPAQ